MYIYKSDFDFDPDAALVFCIDEGLNLQIPFIKTEIQFPIRLCSDHSSFSDMSAQFQQWDIAQYFVSIFQLCTGGGWVVDYVGYKTNLTNCWGSSAVWSGVFCGSLRLE